MDAIERDVERHKNEWQFYGVLVKCGTLIVLSLLFWGLVDTVASRFGPVRPYQTQMYTWPAGNPPAGAQK